METKLKELKKKINALKFAIIKSDIDGFGAYIFINNDTLFSFNGQIKVSCPVATKGISVALPAKEFIEFVNKASGDILLVEEIDDTHVNVIAGKSEITLPNIISILSKIHMVPSTPEEYSKLSEEVIIGFKKCLISYSKDIYTNNPNIMVNFDIIASTDSLAISEYQLDSEFSEEVLMVPGKVIKQIIDKKAEFVTIQDDIIHFSTADDIVYSCMCIDDEFPEYSSFIEEIVGPIIVFPKELVDMLSRMGIIEKNEVIIDIMEGVITCTSKGGKGKITDFCPIDSEEELSFACNPNSFKHALEEFEDGIVSLESGAILFEKNAFTHVVTIWEV